MDTGNTGNTGNTGGHDHEIVAYRQYPLHLERWDADVTVVRREDGVKFLAFRHLCRLAGVDYDKQKEVLAEHPDWYSEESQERFRVDTSGGRQEMLFLRSKEAAWWIVHLNPKRVRPAIRGRLEELKADVMAALDRLTWGDLSDVEVSQALIPVPHGVLYIVCLRCALHMRVVARGGTMYVEVDE